MASNPSFLLVKPKSSDDRVKPDPADEKAGNELKVADKGDGAFGYRDRPAPEIHDPFDAIVAVRWTGICGSDVHYWQEGKIDKFVVEQEMVLGHESSGVIHKLGREAQKSQYGFKEGDKVAIEPGIPCRKCPYCKHGRYNLCPDLEFAATPPGHGTLCKYYRVPVDFCHKLPENISLEEGALVEPAAVAMHVIKLAGVSPGDSVVVYGAGPVGLLCLGIAKAFGAKTVVTVDINPDRVEFAQKYAATAAFIPEKDESPEDAATRLKNELGLNEGPDVVIDATGAEVCIQQGVFVLRRGGTYVQAGMGKPNVNWPMATTISKELTVKGSFRYGAGDWELVIDLIASGKLNVKDLISSKVKFEEAPQAFADTKAAKGIKILIGGPE